jgi:hypothetical protein
MDVGILTFFSVETSEFWALCSASARAGLRTENEKFILSLKWIAATNILITDLLTGWLTGSLCNLSMPMNRPSLQKLLDPEPV